MAIRNVILGAVLLALSLIGNAHAASYYISTSGDDTNNGTSPGAPWRSPSRGQGVRLNGAASAGSTTLSVRDTAGFLPSGSVRLNGALYNYSSKTDTSFSLDSGLVGDANDSDIIQDGTILGGTGFQPGDVINLTGTFNNEQLRFKASGTNSSNIIYQSAPGQRAFFNIVNRPGTSKGVIWNDGEGASTKSEFVTFSGIDVKIDQNGTGGGPAIGLSGANSITFDDMDIHATGSLGDGSIAFRNVKGSSNMVLNSVLRSRFAEGVRGDISGSTIVRNTVIWDSDVGLGQINGGTIDARNLTIIGGPASQLWAAHTENSTIMLNDSIIVGQPTGVWNLTRTALNSNAGATVSGDHNLFFDLSDDNYYGGNWSPGANDQPGANGQPGVDPEFVNMGLDDFSRGQDNWLRFLSSSPAAFASSTGSFIGAKDLVPEPGSFMLLVAAGVGAMARRRR
ncbi:MAG: hypothetical protein CMJ18_00370 [Phycisphaeraceae bacterium]|nr:hypothetical protein [Phycisphaeraceae bacterium]